MKLYSGLYYGLIVDHKDVPFGLYVSAVREINAKIANDLGGMLAPAQ